MSWNLPENPFVGLRPFEAEESLLFFGRHEQTMELMQQLHASRFLAIVGSSGCGKSSLIRAGLIPKLQAGFLVADRDDWLIAKMKPGDTPILNLAAALLQAIGRGEKNAATPFAEAIREQGVQAILDQLAPSLQKTDAILFLLVDQFEELFRFGLYSGKPASKEEAADFVALMLGLAERSDWPVYVALTMRSDFLGDCDAFIGLPKAMNESQYLVPRLTRQQRREAIEGPIRLYQGRIASRLTDRLLNETVDARDDLPVLQHALMRTWAYANRNGKAILDLEHYEAIGTVDKALSRHAEEALNDMDEPTLLLTKRIFQILTEIDAGNRRIRRPAHLSEMAAITGATPDPIVSIIQKFRSDGRSFLVLSSENPADNPVVDISHESLIRQWQTLTRWVSEEAESAKIYRRLAETAELHRQGKAGVYREADLQIALEWRAKQKPSLAWAKRYHADFNQALAFLEKSRQTAEAEKQQQEQQRQERERLLQERAALMQKQAEQQRQTLRWTRLSAVVFLGLTVTAMVLGIQAKRRGEKIERLNARITSLLQDNRNSRSGEKETLAQIVDSLEIVQNTPLHRLIIPKVEATPTKFNDPAGRPLFTISCWIDVPALRKKEIQEVRYYFDHPSYFPKEKLGSDPSANFAISYTGWGCLETVTVTVVSKSGEAEAVEFNMCENIIIKEDEAQLQVEIPSKSIPTKGVRKRELPLKSK